MPPQSRKQRKTRQQRRKPKAKGTSQSHQQSFLLDEFSVANVRSWAKQADAMERYQISLYYALEAQRRHYRGDLYLALQAAALNKPLEFSDWVRICNFRYSHQPLNAYGSTIGAGARFNFGDALDSVDAIPFPAFYVGSNQAIAYREYFGMPRNEKRSLTEQEFLLAERKDVSIIHVNGVVHNVLDITKKKGLQDFVDIIASFSVSSEIDELARTAGLKPRTLVVDLDYLMATLYEPAWRGWVRQHGIPANCQTFGKLAWEAQFDAILYRSTRGQGTCLAVFPQNLQNSETKIWLAGTPPPNVTATLDASNWQLATAP